VKMEFRKELLYKNLHEKEKLIFKEFEEPIYNFLKDLDDKDYLNLEYGESEAENFVLFMGSLEKVVYLLNNLVDNQKVLIESPSFLCCNEMSPILSSSTLSALAMTSMTTPRVKGFHRPSWRGPPWRARPIGAMTDSSTTSFSPPSTRQRAQM